MHAIKFSIILLDLVSEALCRTIASKDNCIAQYLIQKYIVNDLHLMQSIT